MPPNKPQTLLSLEKFRQDINWHPFFFYQLVQSSLTPLTDSADLIVSEYTWQRPMAAARNDFRRAIQSAEQKLCTLLNYDVATRYRQEVVDLNYLRLQNTNAGYGYGSSYMSGYNYDNPARFNLRVGKLQRIGTVGYTALTDFAVIITDEDSDGILDTFTGTFANSDTTLDLSTVVVAFKTADQLPASATGADTTSPVEWLVRPITVTRLNPTTIQVVGPSWLLVQPKSYEKAGPSAGVMNPVGSTGISTSGTFDPNQTGTYVAGLSVWQKVYTDENVATFVRKFGGSEYTFQTPVTIVNADLGQVQIDLWNCYGGVPACVGYGTDELRINYEAGATADFEQAGYLPYLSDWETIVSRFAIAELAQVPAATQRQNPALYWWREDLAHTGSQSANMAADSYRVSNDILNNPFRNTRRGAVEAFMAVSSLAQQRAFNF